jgi:putative DNA primase/helicase
MTSDNIRPDFSSYINGALADLPAEADRLVAAGDAAGTYKQDFIEKCACLDPDTLFDIGELLRRGLKDFSIQEWRRRIKAKRDDTEAAIAGFRPAVMVSSGMAGSMNGKGDPLGYLLNDHGNACRIADLYGDDLRYCYETKSWLVWDGTRWCAGDTGQAMQLAKLAMLEFLKTAIRRGNKESEKFAVESLESRRIAGMLKMLQSDLPIRAIEFDKNPWLLNCPNGTIDLRNSELKAHERSDHITKLIHYRYIPTAKCLLWNNFLLEIMGSSDYSKTDTAVDMVAYLQRAFGYSATGSTSEKAVFIPFGDGNNGKSTMLNTVRQILIEYSTLLQVDTLMTRQENNNTQSDLADLRGARFVQTSETEEGQKLSQGKLKRITQGMGTIRAARKYENMIEFPETHKLWMDTNKKPEIRDAEDQATFNRLHPIPFLVTIEPWQIDQKLGQKLISEAEGILAWIVEGARLWYQKQSLDRPTSVSRARDDWQSSSAQIERFIAERGFVPLDESSEQHDYRMTKPGSGSEIVYDVYKAWCETTGERPFKRAIFNEKMAAHGHKVDASKNRHYFLGFTLATIARDGTREPPFRATDRTDDD